MYAYYDIWNRMMSEAAPESCFAVFCECCAEGGWRVAQGADRGIVAEELTELAHRQNLSDGLGGHIRCQREIEAALDAIEDAPDHDAPKRNETHSIQIDTVTAVEMGLIGISHLEMALVGPQPFGRRIVEALAIEKGLDIQRAMEVGLIRPPGGYHDDTGEPLASQWWQSIPAETRAPSSKALPLTYFGEFGDQTRKRPILKGFINRGETSAVIAPPKRGKSAFVTEIAIYCAAGKDWRGHVAPERCGAVIFALERADLYRRRLNAYQLRDGYKGLPIAVVGRVIDLLDPRCIEIIVETVREAEHHFGCAVGLVAFDTYSKGIAAGGGDENSAKDQNWVAANLRCIQERIDVHITCVGHTGKDESRGARGSNAHLGDVDVMIQITGDNKANTAKVTNANDQPERVIAQFRLELVETGKTDENGEAETTSIIATETVSSADTGNESKLSDIQQSALNEIWNCLADGETAPRPNNVHVPSGVRGVTLATWRKRLADRRIINPDGNQYEQFKRIHVRLAMLSKIGIWEEFVWPVSD